MRKFLLFAPLLFPLFTGAQQSGILIINEIMADPAPPVGLPDAEYIELYNPGQTVVRLKDWQYSDDRTTYTFKGDSIHAGEYLILCPKRFEQSFAPYGRVIGLTPWPTLNNNRDSLTLKDPSGTVIHQVVYRDTWYGDAKKKQGGWSLELRNAETACLSGNPFIASNDASGGTPGRANSVYEDLSQMPQLKLISAALMDSATVELVFNRNISAGNLEEAFFTYKNSVSELRPEGISGNEKVRVKTAPSFPEGKAIEIQISGIHDCRGRPSDPELISLSFFRPDNVRPNDLLISEVLFNPRPGGVDFVEIVNASNKTIDPATLSLANINNKDSVAAIKSLVKTAPLMLPGEYRVFTTDPEKIRSEYRCKNPSWLLAVPALPAYANARGSVVLLNGRTVIDRLDYASDMHHPLLRNEKGVSLERASISRSTNAKGNWHSASAQSGFATPGYENSTGEPAENNLFRLVSKTFSPDADGFEDELLIDYQLTHPETMGSVTIYDLNGRLVRRLIRQQTLGTSGQLRWNGTDEATRLCPPGIYLLTLEAFDPEGRTIREKLPCTLAKRLN
ncbi:MAG: lamin tail domain-containing protein [Mucilaginibacter polytrichastri]|nr:lamin tail domain-containing protein [Mucilaginibacter polytrichastri]